jgi:ribonuclease HI
MLMLTIESWKVRGGIPPRDAVWTIHTDGATLGSNPSTIGGTGMTVWVDGCLYYAQHQSMVGSASNNSAEFFAVFKAIDWCFKNCHLFPTIKTDSTIVAQYFSERGAAITEPRLKKIIKACSQLSYFVTPTVELVKRDSSTQHLLTDFVAKMGCYSTGVYQTAEAHTALIAAFGRHIQYTETNHGD